MAQKPTRMSILSASATAIDTGAVGTPVARADGFVVLLAGQRDGRALAGMGGVVTAH